MGFFEKSCLTGQTPVTRALHRFSRHLRVTFTTIIQKYCSYFCPKSIVDIYITFTPSCLDIPPKCLSAPLPPSHLLSPPPTSPHEDFPRLHPTQHDWGWDGRGGRCKCILFVLLPSSVFAGIYSGKNGEGNFDAVLASNATAPTNTNEFLYTIT